MKWTTQKPSKPGWYWIKKTRTQFIVVRVISKDGNLGVFLDYAGFKKVEYVAKYWSSEPIPEPAEGEEGRMMATHELLPEGESTKNWAFNSPGFAGSIKQFICCARCGEYCPKGKHEPRHFRDIFKPSFHFLCDACHDALPD